MVKTGQFHCDNGESYKGSASGSSEEPGPVVKYKNLFADDRDLRQSTFAELLRFQHLNARKKYLSELERILMENSQEDHVSIGDMRRAILNIDPAKDEDMTRSTTNLCELARAFAR